MSQKPYTTFRFFKLSVVSTALIVLVLVILAIGLDINLFLPLVLLMILFFVLISFRIIQLIYKMQLDREHDTNQIESTMWLYSRFTPSVSLPAMRDYAASPDFLKVMVDQYLRHKPKVIVEASSGVSSIVLSEILMKEDSNAEHYALDHLEKYANLTREKIKNVNSHIIHAPLKDYKIGDKTWQWYDLSALEKVEQIDMLVVDGPPGDSQSKARFPALPLLMEKMSPRAIIILDDSYRPDEKEIIRSWEKDYGFKATELFTEKGTVVMKRNA